MKAIRAARYGGPEVLELAALEKAAPGRGEVLLRVDAAGVNFIDVYQRTGLYKTALPVRLGLEGAGVVEAVGEGVSRVRAGDRVAWANVPGSYATHVVAKADDLVAMPQNVAFRDAAAVLLQGMTAHYLTKGVTHLGPDDVCLVHAAAGGVGLLLCQMAKRAGARVIGTVSTEEKEALARRAGADDVIRYTEVDFEAEIHTLTGGRGVTVVYDSVGKTTFEKSLRCLRARGHMVSFGQSSGPVPPFDVLSLAPKSLSLTRPKLGDYTSTLADLTERGTEVLTAVADGSLHLTVSASFPLHRAGDAHRALEGRKTTGKVVLLP